MSLDEWWADSHQLRAAYCFSSSPGNTKAILFGLVYLWSGTQPVGENTGDIAIFLLSCLMSTNDVINTRIQSGFCFQLLCVAWRAGEEREGGKRKFDGE